VTPYLIPVDVRVARNLGFSHLLSNRCRISAPVDLIGRTQVGDEPKLTGFSGIVISTGIPRKSEPIRPRSGQVSWRNLCSSGRGYTIAGQISLRGSARRYVSPLRATLWPYGRND